VLVHELREPFSADFEKSAVALDSVQLGVESDRLPDQSRLAARRNDLREVLGRRLSQTDADSSAP
jgi:hypothetical protein